MAVLLVMAGACSRRSGSFRLESVPESVVADGYSRARIVARAVGGAPREFRAEVVEGGGRASIARAEAAGDRIEITVRAGVEPGPVSVRLTAERFAPAIARYVQTADYADANGDGTPDVLGLDDPADREAFRQWFTFLAESQYFAEKPRAEVSDCAGLLRFAYRGALETHDAAWYRNMRLPQAPLPANAAKYAYPHTLLEAALFRVKPGAFTPGDVSDGSFAEFADAETLMRRNTWFVSREIERAEPGDLLFFRQLEQAMPFHAMIYLGPSRVEADPAKRLVYHTGPVGKQAGEVRRPTVDELMRHPSPRWRPVTGNPNFLGVFRWNILRDTY